MSEKKVIAVIVEGPSDENALGGILEEFFSSEEVQFTVVHGDITSDYHTTLNNAVTKVGDVIERLRSQYGYQWGDLIKIIHIADTDGAFTRDCIRQTDVKSIQYYEDHIEYADVDEVKRRNQHKAEIMFKLCATGKIRKTPYRLYFNSCNLEHVLYEELKDFSDEEKEILSDDFAEKYEGKLSDFIHFISDKSVAVEGSYKETWKYIEKDKNSLQRHSNMHLIFETPETVSDVSEKA